MKNFKSEDVVLFPFGRLGKKKKAIFYCGLHKCFMTKGDLICKNFKCNKCIHKKPVEEG